MTRVAGKRRTEMIITESPHKPIEMGKLDDVSGDALRTHLDEADGSKAAKRLMVALSYKDGVTVETMSRRYGIPASTIYYWLDRFVEGSIEDAITDEPRPGRPPALDDTERVELAETLAADPDAAGYDAPEWTPDLVRTHVSERYGVSYSLGHVRRLMRELSPD